jgi:antitoxin Phd
MASKIPNKTRRKFPRAQQADRWRLRDAKARFSELVRQARQRGPQRVTLYGRDVVVVLRADVFDRLLRPISGRAIVAALATSPLGEVTIERLMVKSPVRDVGF